LKQQDTHADDAVNRRKQMHEVKARVKSKEFELICENKKLEIT